MSPLIFMEMGKVFRLIVFHSVSSLCEKDIIIVIVTKGSISLELLVYYLFGRLVGSEFSGKVLYSRHEK